MNEQKRIEVKVTIEAAAEDIFDALTKSDQVEQWFSEYADISLPQKRYAFWGGFTPEAPDRTQGDHPLTAVEPNRHLQFKWQFRGAKTTVEITLESKAAGTDLTLIHVGLLPYQDGQYAMADFWSLSLENLRNWVERKTIGPRCDFSTIPYGQVCLQVDIDASPETVFQALIKPEELERYVATKARVEPQAGGVYDYGWGEEGGPIKILDLVPDEKLVFDWTWTGKEQPEPATTVTWTLEGSGGKTHLTLVHSGFAPDRACQDYQVGWLHFLNRLKFLVEVGPTWQKAQFLAADH